MASASPSSTRHFLILLNPHHEPIRFYMPAMPGHGVGARLGFGRARTGEERPIISAGEFYELIPRSTAVLRELAD